MAQARFVPAASLPLDGASPAHGPACQALLYNFKGDFHFSRFSLFHQADKPQREGATAQVPVDWLLPSPLQEADLAGAFRERMVGCMSGFGAYRIPIRQQRQGADNRHQAITAVLHPLLHVYVPVKSLY